MKNLKSYGTYSFGLVLFFGLIWLVSLTSSNVEKARPNQYEFAVDTIAQTANGTFTIPQFIKNKTGYVFQVTAAQLSGTIGSSAIIRESCWETANRWVNVDTVAISAAGNVRIEGVTRARRLQVYILADSTTQSGQYYVAGQLTEEF